MNDRRDKIRLGLQIAAKLVARDGPAYLPFFERLEREIAQLEATESAIDRARRMAGDDPAADQPQRSIGA